MHSRHEFDCENNTDKTQVIKYFKNLLIVIPSNLSLVLLISDIDLLCDELAPYTLCKLTTSVYTVHCTLYIVQCTMYNVQCTMYSVQCTMYTVQCTLYNVQCTMYNVQYTLYNVHCTLYSVQCILYNIHCTIIPYTAYKHFIVITIYDI